ncbi:lipase/acyltransferase domain-containing protein [Bacillus cereus]|uniref:lipase/acyltransferase domain-containing protein n=2 Tax=Bacillus cereus TaxID=1396 RepID=UPI0018F27CE4|nr:hypothetical protein [Bacillus cereus]
MSVCIFVPGIKGTELYEGDNKRWFPSTKKDLLSLGLQNKLEARQVLGAVNAFFLKKEDLYQGVIEKFIDNPNFIPYPYDWRFSLLDIVDDFVEFIVGISAEKDDDIILIAHSMGGVLSKLAILKLQEMGLAHLIKKMVTIGTPWKGSPDAYKVLEYGEPGIYSSFSQILSMFDDQKTRSLARKLPSVYQLLPSEEYYRSPYGNFIIGAEKDSLIYDEVKSKIQAIYNAENKNSEEENVIDVWKEFINPIHEAMRAELPVEHDCLIGIDQPTFYSFPEKSYNTFRLYKANAVIKNGDGVVPFYSAFPYHKANMYYVASLHRNQCSNPDVLDFIEWVLDDKQTDQPINVGELQDNQVEEQRLIENTKLEKGILTRILCPVETTILDKEHSYVAGVIDPSLSEYSDLIHSDDVQYLQVGDAKYLYVREEEELDFEINAYKEGIAEVSVEVFNDDTTEIQFNTIPISPKKNARLKIHKEQGGQEPLKVELQYNGEALEPKIKKKQDESTVLAELPKIELSFKKMKGTEKTPHIPVYSGPVMLTVKTETPELVEELLCAIEENNINRLEENRTIIDLPSGNYKIQVFGKDIYGRPLKSKEHTIKFDKDTPNTQLKLVMTPDYSVIKFEVNTFGSKFKTYYRIIAQDRIGEYGSDEGWECVKKSNENIDIPYDIIQSLSYDKNKVYVIQYFSENEFGAKEPIKDFSFSLGDLPSLMWGDVVSNLTAKTIFRNITKDSEALDQENIRIEQMVQKKYVPLDSKVYIGDNVQSVLFTSDDCAIEIFYSEKYALYFSGPPTELLEIGQRYTFSFELITERTKERVANTEPKAKLKPIKPGGHGKEERIELVKKDDVFYGSFAVSELFKEYKHRLIITDVKNVTPPLRESVLMLREEESKVGS